MKYKGGYKLIAIGSDHAGFALKEEIKKHLDEKGIEYKDFGTYSDERANYAEFGEKVAEAIANGEYDRGILVCGTGIGISIAANKVKGIRAAACSDYFSAVMSKKHNNSNILALGARVVGVGLATTIVDGWLEAKFEGGRHKDRIDYIAKIEE